MPDPITAGVILVGAASTYGAYQSYDTARETKGAAKRQTAAADQLNKDEEKKRQQAAMRSSRRKDATQSPGTRDTILTGPLGVPGPGTQAGQKTLLGL